MSAYFRVVFIILVNLVINIKFIFIVLLLVHNEYEMNLVLKKVPL